MDEQKEIRRAVFIKGIVVGIVLSVSPILSYLLFQSSSLDEDSLFRIIRFAIPFTTVILCCFVIRMKGMKKWGISLCIAALFFVAVSIYAFFAFNSFHGGQVIFMLLLFRYSYFEIAAIAGISIILWEFSRARN